MYIDNSNERLLCRSVTSTERVGHILRLFHDYTARADRVFAPHTIIIDTTFDVSRSRVYRTLSLNIFLR